ncbi:MAG: hypothetical protein AB1499_00915 [Nitrospirota bacterium]
MSKSEKAANIILGSAAIFFLLIFFYAMYRSHLHPPGQMIKYYILSITGSLCFTVALLRCDKEMKLKISLLLITTLICIYSFEIILSYKVINKPEPIREKIAAETGLPYDSRSGPQVWLDLRNQGIDAYPFYSPYENIEIQWRDILPLSFISGKTTIQCNESGEWIIYKSDEHGFNNPEGLYIENQLDYVLIGDSFTHGFCTKREENIAGWLTKTGKRVLNLGMGNTSPLIQLAILKEYGKPFKPKYVFWFFFEGNDHEGLAFDKKSSILVKYLENDFTQHLLQKQKVIDELLSEYADEKFELIKKDGGIASKYKREGGPVFSLSFSSIVLSQLRKKLGISESCICHVDPLFKDIFAEAKRTINSWDGKLVFVYLPDYSRYPKRIDKCRKRFLDTGKTGIIKIIKDLEIPVLDIQSVFDSHPDPLSFFPFKLFGHYNADAYKLIAEEIEKYLSTGGVALGNHSSESMINYPENRNGA